MMTISEMRERKKAFGYTNEKIAELSGVPLGTVQKIFSGATTTPRYDTKEALERALSDPAPEPPRCLEEKFPWNDQASRISEEASCYSVKRQGEFTLEDYYKIPQDYRAELIDGVLFTMDAPSSAHQLIVGLLHARLLQFQMAKKGQCLPMVSPVDVQLDCDERTMVEPDVIIVCDRDKVIQRCVYGAPDFVAEILSPSTSRKDCLLKLDKYRAAGVREYWIIDPRKKKVIVYDFEHEEYPAIYGFDAKIPVAIWGGECVVDFGEIYEYIRFLYEKGEPE